MKPYDTIVIGAGVAGLSVARELAKRKQRVLVVEQEEIGGSASRAAAGILDPYTEAKEETPLFRLGVKALEFYPSFLQELGEKTPARVEYEKAGVLYLGLSAEDEDLLKDRFEWQKKRRLPVESVSLDKVRKMEPALSPLVRNGIFYPEIPKLNADKLTQALLEEARSEGVELKTSVGGSSVWTEGKKVRGVKTSQESFESRSVVAASGPWAGLDPNLGIGKSVKSVRGQILILRTNASFQPTHILHTIHYAYIVPWPGNRILVGSTLETHAGFDCRVTPEGKEEILKRAGEIYADIRSLAVEKTWAGLRPYAGTGDPLIGPSRTEGLFLALGYYRSGILISPLVGRLLAEGIVTGIFSPLLEPFYPQ